MRGREETSLPREQRNETILVVDDEPGILEAYRQYLDPPQSPTVYRSSRSRTAAAGQDAAATPGIRYRVLLARSGEQAVELVKEELVAGRRVAAGFFDIKMPGGMDGLQTIKAVRALDPDVLCAVVTAYNDRSVDDIGRFFPAQRQDEWDYLNKPFTEGEIRQKARNLVSSWQRRRREEAQRQNLEHLIRHLSQLKGLGFPDLLRCLDYVLQQVVAFTGSSGGFLATLNEGPTFQVGTGTLASAGSATDALERLRASGLLDRFLLDPNVHATADMFVVPILCVRADRVVVFLRSDDSLEDKRDLVRIFAENAAAAVDNYHLYQELQQLNASLEERIQARTHELTDSNQRLSQTTTELGQMLERLKETQQQLVHSEKLAVMGQMAATVAHEINNPGFVIQVNLDEIASTAARVKELVALLDQGADAAAVRAWRAESGFDEVVGELDAMVGESQAGLGRILTIVRDLRSFGRIDREEIRSVGLADLVDKALRILGNELRHRAAVDFVRREAAEAQAGEGRLLQVLLNVLTNALHAMETRPTAANRIEISAWSEGDTACFSVRDNGSGIPPEIIGKIFDPFFTTKPVGQGTGLGLGICRSIIEQYGGAIRVSSQPGVGTEVTVALPRAPVSANEPAA
jgi:two-component system, NtrC family, sensor kinase